MKKEIDISHGGGIYTLVGEYYPATPDEGYPGTPGEPASFEAEEIFYNGVDVFDVIEDAIMAQEPKEFPRYRLIEELEEKAAEYFKSEGI